MKALNSCNWNSTVQQHPDRKPLLVGNLRQHRLGIQLNLLLWLHMNKTNLTKWKWKRDREGLTQISTLHKHRETLPSDSSLMGEGNPQTTPSLLHSSLLPITVSFDANMQPDIHKEIELGSTSLQNQIKLPLGCFITLFTTERHFSGTCNLL